MANGIDTLKAQWDFLFAMLQQNMNFGPTGPGSGSNAAGLLQTVASVGQSDWPEFNALPFVGVALKDWDESEAFTQKRKLVSVFQIVAVVDVVASGSSVIQLADAYKKLMAILSDGNGNGIYPLLHDPANYFLGGAAEKTVPRKGKTDWANKPAGKGTDYVAYVTVMLYAETHFGPI